MSVGIVNLAEVELREMAPGENVCSHSACASALVGAKALGCNLVVRPPGPQMSIIGRANSRP